MLKLNYLFASAVLLLGLCLTDVPVANAQSRYVTDQFEVMMRRGPSIQNAIVRQLPSGTALELLETDSASGYSKVRTQGGAEGWVLTRQLMNDPAARDQIVRLQQRLNALRSQSGDQGKALDDTRQREEQLKGTVRSLESGTKRLEAELSEIKRTAANVLRINEENKTLRENLSQAEIKLSTLEQENDRLVSRREQNWFLIGAAVLIIGIILGLVIPRIPRHRRGRYRDSL